MAYCWLLERTQLPRLLNNEYSKGQKRKLLQLLATDSETALCYVHAVNFLYTKKANKKIKLENKGANEKMQNSSFF